MTDPIPAAPIPSAPLIAQAEAARAAGDAAAAEAAYRAAIAHGSENPAVAYNIGTFCARRGDWHEARGWFARATTWEPAFAQAWYNLGCAERETGRFSEARNALEQALTLAPGLHDARVNLSLVLFALGDTEAALRTAHQALEARPDDPDVFANLATFLRVYGAPDEARACAEAALRLDPGHAGAWQALGALAQDRRAHALAIRCYGNALRHDPEHASSHWNRALALLATGDYAAGWAEYEWRQRLPGMPPHYPDFGLPRWQGEPLSGKTLLLHAEQGHGDTLQFVRLARPLRAQGARVVLLAQPALVRLLARCPWLDAVHPLTAPPARADYVLPLLSLPHRLGLTLDTLPDDVPYLDPVPEEIAAWRQRLAHEPRPRIGLAWAGDPRPHDLASHRIDARRSLPFAALRPLLDLDGHAWFSLQKGEAAAQAAGEPRLLDHTAEWRDFADTAAFISALDLVITVDTAVAHLAAALGKPTWMLSRFDGCWRWLDNRPTSPWYPTLRLFGQIAPGDWSAPLAALGGALRDSPPWSTTGAKQGT